MYSDIINIVEGYAQEGEKEEERWEELQ